jgi:hypothetical protein
LDCISALQRRYGFRGYRLDGCAYIDIARAALCRMVEVNDHAGALFIDHDILFNPDDAYELCVAAERTGCVVSGIYCMRATGDRIIGIFDASVSDVTCFEGGGLYPAPWSGLGFTAIPRKVLDDVARPLPRLKSGFIEDVAPMFALRSLADAWPLAREIERILAQADERGLTGYEREILELVRREAPPDHEWYSGEDISFFHRVAEAGHKLLVDTRPRLWHKGSYRYGLEDRQVAVPRARTLHLKIRHEGPTPLVPADSENFDGFINPVGSMQVEGAIAAAQ